MKAGLSPHQVQSRIQMAMQSGDLEEARAIAKAALRANPRDGALAHTSGNLALKAGDAKAAAKHFEAAAKRVPGHLDYTLDHAIALQQLGRHDDVVDRLSKHEDAGRNVIRYASIRALSHKELGQLDEAAEWYDSALSLDPRHPRALHGRARIALERGEADALLRFDQAISVNPGDADIWLGKANALDVSGDTKGAMTVASQIAEQGPAYLPGQSFLAQMRLAAGDADFAAHFADAAAKLPQDPNIPAAHCDVLSGLDRANEAADIAAQARKRFPQIDHFALLEAVHSGTAGDWDRAEAIFAALINESPLRFLNEARHRLRKHDLEAAEHLLDKALIANQWDIAAWALRGIVWRLAGDDRAEWLHAQDGLVQFLPLEGADGLIERSTAFLRELHTHSAMPLGQSLRGGTQTRGILFHRMEPVIRELRDAIARTMESYRENLPKRDEKHPLLRHSKAAWKFDGSWSVRLTGGGDFHTSHIHPKGIVSSALYLIVPEDSTDEGAHNGCLEVGRPPPDLSLDLDPVRTIQPIPGHLALFPSTLYHGTTPFTSSERMTVAFDVVSQRKSRLK
ncbi:putative 2OG-Fe(II) oxygenase [Erythrobacter crassostreae]|uniref:Tetratricopeptide repeat protein n=1 Tax=Erythrobacter crassostreae TaxID=2828328 RepID=A0A9X1F4B6_9SPHN|nr:putative 2OG-Fe(II) oxygenase [Erythrobacter crassostrea]MBV7259243.1 tetratricopeptide repeat protein [Erythrobacter crassostrea]